MSAARFACYLEGGCPPGGLVHHRGARDAAAPRATVSLTLPGSIYFAGESHVWGGGRAYYDPTVVGGVPARGYLITHDQFEDVREQEPPVYDRLIEVGVHDGDRMLTFTSTLTGSQVARTTPAPAYLDAIATGIREAHGWDENRIRNWLREVASRR